MAHHELLQPDYRGENEHPVQRRVSCRRLITRGDGYLELITDGRASIGGTPSSASRRRVTISNNNDDDDDTPGDVDDNAAEILALISLWREILFGIREGVWYILLSTLVGMAIALYTVVLTSSGTGTAGATETLHLKTRRVPPLDEQFSMHDARMQGATTIYLGDRRQVTLQGMTAAPKQGHLRLPNQFYQGIHFGLSGWNQWGEKLSHEENRERNVLLRKELKGLDPRPSAVYRTTFEDGTEGFTLAYIASALAQQKGRSVRQRSDPVWLEAEQAVLAMARKFQQLVITKWYPEVWGPGHEHDPDAHSSILQQIRPTRTGLRALASTVVVHHVLRRDSTSSKISHPAA